MEGRGRGRSGLVGGWMVVEWEEEVKEKEGEIGGDGPKVIMKI